MTVPTVATLVHDLRQHRLLGPAQLEELTGELARLFPQPKALAREMLRRGWLTPYQINQLFQGRGAGLALGPYVLLERLGAGGMGQVFKARQQKLDRVVALKVIRKERLTHPDAGRRFLREIRAAAQLSHPNIVLALDADDVAGTPVLVMEYVEGGIDLARLVRQAGPLPVEQACDYLRQAALGLQHAHERGLIHRDIKPSNLLLDRQGRIKLLDLGLARLQEASDGDDSGTLTREGVVMGTPDFIAPEQARDSRSAEARSDLYSLGCTFYYLLTGQVPFPGGTVMSKLIQHHQEEPVAVEQLRPDVPAEVGAVVRKLMAKAPEDRFQTAAELVAVLASGVKLGVGLDGRPAEEARPPDEPVLTAAEKPPAPTASEAVSDTATPWSAILDEPPPEEAASPSLRLRRKQQPRQMLVLGGAAAAVLLLAVAVTAGFLLRRPPPPRLSLAPRDPPPAPAEPVKKEEALPFNAWLTEVAGLPADKQVEAVAAKLKELNPEFDGKVTHRIDQGVVTELGLTSNRVTDVSPVRALPGLRALRCEALHQGHGKLSDLTPLAGLRLTQLSVGGQIGVRDLVPLRGMPLTWLSITFTSVESLSALRGMPLTTLVMNNCAVRDLTPLAGLRLTHLTFGGWDSRVSDLSPLRGMPLQGLSCGNSRIHDLAPLRGMPLAFLSCPNTSVHDLSPLKGLPLKTLSCDFRPWRDTEVLRAVKRLATINGQPAAEFLRKADEAVQAAEDFRLRMAALPPREQVAMVAARLRKANPGFDGTLRHHAEDGVVTELRLDPFAVTDLAPLRALTGLKVLECPGNAVRRGRLADLTPLLGLPLTRLNCALAQVADLGPLHGLPLADLDCGGTPVRDLAPLAGLPLTRLRCTATGVTDLTPLKGLPLAWLDCSATGVRDLSPLQGMPLETLTCSSNQIGDLAPLRGLPLKKLVCDFRAERDAEPLRAVRSLEVINTQAAPTFWRRAEAQLRAGAAWRQQVAGLPAAKQVEAVALKLQEVNPGFRDPVQPRVQEGAVTELEFLADRLTDLSPLRALPELRVLTCGGSAAGRGRLFDLSPLRSLSLHELSLEFTQVYDLSPLQGMPLTSLNLNGTRVTDLSPLRGSPLRSLFLTGSEVHDLSPLAGMRLEKLDCAGTRVADLSPLRGLPLAVLHCDKTAVADLTPLSGSPLKELSCPFPNEPGLAVLRSIQTLKAINGKSATAFWRRLESWQSAAKP
jgi:serine/threonine protein kinase/Leucine-rich repeat (LRR) protein